MGPGSGAELRVLGSSPRRGGLWQAGPRQGAAWLQPSRTSRLSPHYRLRWHQSVSSTYGSRAGTLHNRGGQHAPARGLPSANSPLTLTQTQTLGFS